MRADVLSMIGVRLYLDGVFPMLKSKRAFLSFTALCAVASLLGPIPAARADALGDCRIVLERSDGSTMLAYVVNTNQSRTIQVTVACTETNFPNSPRRLPDQVHILAPGQRAFCGGTVSNRSTYTYTVVGAQYR
jgi:hypothetical protein